MLVLLHKTDQRSHYVGDMVTRDSLFHSHKLQWNILYTTQRFIEDLVFMYHQFDFKRHLSVIACSLQPVKRSENDGF